MNENESAVGGVPRIKVTNKVTDNNLADKVEVGREKSALNACQHGLNSDHLLLPGEDPVAYQEAMDAWFEALAPASIPEAQIVGRITDANWKLERLRRLEHQRQLVTLERKVQATAEWKRMNSAGGVLLAVKSLAETVEACPAPTKDALAGGRFIDAANRVAAAVGALDALPLLEVERFEKAVDALTANSRGEGLSIPDYQALGEAAGNLITNLKAEVETAEAVMPIVREKIATEELLMNSDDLKLHLKYQNLLFAAMDKHFALLRELRAQMRAIGDKVQGDAEEFKLKVRIAH